MIRRATKRHDRHRVGQSELNVRVATASVAAPIRQISDGKQRLNPDAQLATFGMRTLRTKQKQTGEDQASHGLFRS